MIENSQHADNCRCKSGFTLLETIIVVSLLSVLVAVSAHIFVVGLRVWSTGSMRTEIREDISYAMDKTVRDLKQAANASLQRYNAIAHTLQYDDLAGNTYVLYLYNPADASVDSTYGETLYNLRKADINGGDSPASGDGMLILKDLVSPDAAAPATSLTIDPGGTQISLDFAVQRNDETVEIRTTVRPRNL